MHRRQIRGLHLAYRALFIAWVGVLLIGARSLLAQDVWDRADSAVLRLEPHLFVQLPSTIRDSLATRRCRLPQASWFDENPHNVVQGHFAGPDQTDWAVLCSRAQQSVILVFWGGPIRCPGEFSSSADRDWLQGVGEGVIGFSRLITPIDAQRVLQMQQDYGRDPPRILLGHPSLPI
jgi:hypothetical protein